MSILSHRCRIVCLIVLLSLAAPAITAAQVQSNNFLGPIINEYKAKAEQWRPVILDAAKRLFWILAGIELAWTALMLGLRRVDLTEWAAELARHILFIGFFYGVLMNSGVWTKAIVDSLWQLAGEASASAGGSGDVNPDNIFDIGVNIALALSEAYSVWQPGASLGLAIAALIIAICFALIAAFLVLALVEMYIVLNAGVILLGLGATRWTSDYAVKYLTYAFSVGMKLFVLQLLLGLGESMMLGWAQSVQVSQDQVFVIVGGSIVMLALVYSIPNLIQSLITGISNGSGQGMTAALGAVGGAAMGAAAATAGAGSATYQATKLAREEGATGMWSVAKAASAHLAQGAGDDLMGQLAGGNRFGTMGGRMAQNLAGQRDGGGQGFLDADTISAAFRQPGGGGNMPSMPGADASGPAPESASTYISGVSPDVNPPRYDQIDADSAKG